MAGIIFCGIAVVLAIVEVVREFVSFRVARYRVGNDKSRSMGLAGYKVVFLSDLHNQKYGEGNVRLIKRIREEKPDLILIGGDMLVGKKGYNYDNALAFVKTLPGICPVYYANGNHEQRMKEEPEKYEQSFLEYKKVLEAAGVRFLENSHAYVEMGNAGMHIYGLEIPRRCYRHLGKTPLSVRELERCIGKAKQGAYNILLAHNPNYMEVYKEWGADLILSGHLHGGVVRIPGGRGVITPNLEFFPKYSGEQRNEGGQDIVVSRGLGTHTIRIRLFNQAEVIVLTIE